MANAYHEYENLLVWRVLDDALSALVANRDMKEMTARSHLVGYLVQQLAEAGVVRIPEQGPPGEDSPS